MKIALISEHASPLACLGGVDSGGQNVYVAQLGRYLNSFGYEVDIFTRRDDPSQRECLKLRDNLQVIHVPAGPAEYVPKEGLYEYMDEFVSYMYRHFRQAEKPYDLVHANFWMSAYAAMKLKRLFDVPFVVTFHALGKIRRLHQRETDGFPEERLQIEEEIMREADGIIAECPQDELDMIELYKAQTAKIRMIPCGFDPRDFAPISKEIARKKLGLPPGEKILLQLGRLVPRKGIDTVIRGMAKFLKDQKGPARTRLLIVGGNSEHPDPIATPEIMRLRRIAFEEGVLERVQFAGQVRRKILKYYYSAADVFITTPWYEPFGITPLEAMACGTPVIGSEVGGIKYTVQHGITGLLIPAKNTNALADSLNELWKSPERIAAMGKRSLERVRDFTWGNIARMVSNLYEEVGSSYVQAGSVSR